MELNKALMTASGNTNLYQEDLSARIYDMLRKELPLWDLFGTEQAQGPVHRFRKRTAYPAGWFEAELSAADFRSGTYTTKDVALKIMRNWGQSFMQSIDTFAKKIAFSDPALA